MTRRTIPAWALLLIGAAVGAILSRGWGVPAVPRAVAADEPKLKTPDLASLAAEIEMLKGKAPDQAHAMQDVGYHYSNLWFAGQHSNWDLANFYWSETRSHLRWAVRIIPKRKDLAGKEVDLAAILQALENGPLKQLEDSIKAKDKTQFEKSYRATSEGCYSCHKASDKPYLRPQIPAEPESRMLNFDPTAEWPK